MSEYDNDYLEETLRKAFEDPALYKLPKGVIRYDYAHTHGWWVRVTRNGAPFRKLFSDGQFPSIADGLRSAIIHRHELLASFPVTLKHIHARSLPLDPEQRLQLLTEKGRGNKAPYVCWEAKWYDQNHKVCIRSFSVKKFGNDEARALALSAARSNHNMKPKLTALPDSYRDEKWRELPRADIDVFATINSDSYRRTGSAAATAAADPFAFEGEKIFELHQSIERDKNLRARKIEQFLTDHEKLHCEVCSFQFSETYPFLVKDIIEVHHVVPLHTLNKSTKVTLNDLMLLCANCHLAIHQGDAEENLIYALDIFVSQSSRE